uniref:Uncharacterized protein n=1 Tax=Tanacetum cinerariifolium TaxID=118510 RepID=A0A6L2KU88_TANCI|nr:hypothetical protein [Tanacetum cinerariifolium]
MDEPNITMEEYIRLKEEKVLNNTPTSEGTHSYEPTVSPPDENKIDFRISLDKSDDEDYTIIFDEISISYKIISINVLKTDSENDTNNMLSLPKTTVNYLDDLDFFNKFENEFPAIVYKDGLTPKSDLEIKPLVSSERIDGFNINDESSSEYNENVLYFNDLFNIIHPDDFKIKKDNDGNDIDIIQSSEDGVGVGCCRYAVFSDGRCLEGDDMGTDYLGVGVTHGARDGKGWHAKGRKSRARLSGGNFIRHLAMHFGLVSDEGLRGLQVVTQELPLIDLHELGRLNICTRYGDTWSWIAHGPERQQAGAAGTHKDDEVGPTVEERRVRPRTGDASTFATPDTDAQPDP